MAAASNIIASAGIYDLSNPGALLGGFVGRLTSRWSESIIPDPDGGESKYFLVCNSNDGEAYNELIKGQMPLVYGIADGSGNGFKIIAAPTLNSTVPITKWLYVPSQKYFYKIISVMTNNLIQVENISGEAFDAIDIEAVVTIGFSVKNILLTIPSEASVKVYGYRTGISYQNNSIEYPAGVVPVQIPVDLENSGPLYINGGCSVNVQGRYSNAE